MPSPHDISKLPAGVLTLSANMHTHNYNGKNQKLSPQDILNNQAEKWQIPITSEAFARKLDENDPLRHVRDEFYYPKIGNLRQGIFIYNKFSNTKLNLYI
jgi:hypothetical protein